ncbi:hypothetical protein [Streptomyces sp. Isolate_45]|uniref:hypothetical protein n=1 Tax=Streptomyces sp. Isolate_45 TaxID=2950111 RepID=UPI002481D5C4|nr:hypothetical protein [Streptomyces sp. Isolate_45]MDA5284626.1 hypothetical protein [Streptomyces sp. Isolate_45]
MHQHPHTTPAPTPVLYQPQPLGTEHQALVLPTTDPRRALVQLDTGHWVLANVPAAPPVIVPAAPEATPRRPLSGLERGAITVVGSICALTLSAGGALAMAGPYLAHLASLAFGAAALLGTAAAGWAALRLTGALSRVTAPAARQTTAATSYVTHVTNTVSSKGMFSRAQQTTHIHQG